MKVPQIVDKAGVSADYWNEYFGKGDYLKRGLSDSSFAEFFKKYHIKKYEQRFPPEKYEDVVTPQNKASVSKLNELADVVNGMFMNVSRFTELDFKKVINEVHNLIYGEDYFYPEVTGHP